MPAQVGHRQRTADGTGPDQNERMDELRFAIVGTGFWSRFQLAAWRELEGARCVALCNRTRSKAEALARAFGVPRVYDDTWALLTQERLDFVDIITSVETHPWLVGLAAQHGADAICQKPMATTLGDAERMVDTCHQAGVKFLVHENWRWQRPIRQLRHVLDEGHIGRPFRATIDFCSSFPVFDNQPFLRELEQFILTDMGSHILDTARFLFGEVERVFCETHRVHSDIRGEDVATVMMRTRTGTAVVCNISYASHTEREAFPQTFILVEGEHGSVELDSGYWIRTTDASGTLARRYAPPHYAWADPAYDLVHASIVPCNANLLASLRGEGEAETTGEDNLETMRLVFAAYESARTGRAVTVSAFP